MAKIDTTYLKKRAEMTRDFYDEKVQAALCKIIPPNIIVADADRPRRNEYEIVVKNKVLRNWIDLISDKDRSFVRFVYEDGDESDINKYIEFAFIGPVWKAFKTEVSKDPSDKDLLLMRLIIWNSFILKNPIGVDFGKYEMNTLYNNLPIDISKNKIKLETPSFVDFYRQIMFAKWGIENVN
jgi:hypothetical protein